MSVRKLIKKKKGLAVLIDPDKQDKVSLGSLCALLRKYPPDLILVGGSLLFKDIRETIVELKALCDIPVYIFPGDVSQLADNADGVFFLSLITGRNPEFLIGNHVIAAPKLKAWGLDVIPTAYMLIENGHSTSVEYMSNTKPIPYGKSDLAVATALAGQMLGMHQLYLEAGSGAAQTVGIDMIRAIRNEVDLPLIVGGGIRTVEDASSVYNAGADMIVIGTRLEEFPEQIEEFVRLRDTISG